MVKHKETESESEGAPHAEERHFRIAVCMKRFYSDHRARALLYVSARRRVRWLQRRLRRLFALPPALELLCRGHLLPRDEPLALLDRDDLVEVVPVPAEFNIAATTREVVASDTAPSAEAERTPSPGPPDDLSESKRRALLVLEQYCGGDEAGPVEAAQRVKRRRVRRRRRPAPTEPEHSNQVSDEEHSLESAGVFREPETAVAVLRNDLRPRAPRLVRDVSRCDVPQCELPRCDVPLCDVPRCDVPLCDVPRCDMPLCDLPLPVPRCDVSLSAFAHTTPFTKIYT